MMTLNQAYLQAQFSGTNRDVQPARAALKLYYGASARAWLGRVWSALTGRSRHLLDLGTIRASVRPSHYAGIRAVPIRQIRGSEERREDFDADFWPLQLHNRGRWLRVAMAQQGGTPLPPVELIQVGDVYFVRDGHHRISVARAMGQVFIDAQVTVWK